MLLYMNVKVLFCRSIRESAMLRCLEESIKAILDSDMKIKLKVHVYSGSSSDVKFCFLSQNCDTV